MNIAALVVAHGSRTEESYRELQDVVKFVDSLVNGKRRLAVYLAYNEKKDGIPVPDWREVLEHLAESGTTHIVFVPLFIVRGVHVERDILRELFGGPVLNQWTKITWRGRTINIYVTKPLSSSTLFKLAIASNIMRALEVLDQDNVSYSTDARKIESESLKKVYFMLEAIGWTEDEFQRNVVARVVFASGNIDLAYHVYVHPMFLSIAKEVLPVLDVPVVADVKMVFSGIRWRNKYVFIDKEEVVELASKRGLTRAAASMIFAASRFKTFVPVIGNSPSALLQILKMVKEEGLEIPFVIATPPGFVNAVVAKEKLIEAKIPCITVRGSYGGSSLAVAIFNGVVDYVKQR